MKYQTLTSFTKPTSKKNMPKLSDFKIGDKVRITSNIFGSDQVGQICTVMAIHEIYMRLHPTHQLYKPDEVVIL